MNTDLLQGFQLGGWRVEPLRGAVIGPGGEACHLEPKMMDVFVLLATRANELVTREKQFAAMWQGKSVFYGRWC